MLWPCLRHFVVFKDVSKSTSFFCEESYSLNEDSSAIDLLINMSILGVGDAFLDVDFLLLISISSPLKGLKRRETSVMTEVEVILPVLVLIGYIYVCAHPK